MPYKSNDIDALPPIKSNDTIFIIIIVVDTLILLKFIILMIYFIKENRQVIYFHKN